MIAFIFLISGVVAAQELTPVSDYAPEVRAALAALQEAQGRNLQLIGTLNYRYVASYAVDDDLCSSSPNNVPMPSLFPTRIFIVVLMVKLRDGSDGHFTYHVTAGGEEIELCDEQIFAPTASPTVTASATTTPSRTPTSTATVTPRSLQFWTNTPRAPTPTPTLESDLCLRVLPSHLVIGGQGRVTPGLPNNVRDVPSASGRLIGQIDGGEVLDVLEGPVCDHDGRVWWRVQHESLIGWTPEGQDGTYYIIPVGNTLSG